MVLNKDFREFVTLLNEAGVKYLIVGGYAVAYHGYPRYTGDLDIWIWIEDENVSKVLRSIHAFGFASVNLQLTDLKTPASVIQLGYPPFRIDIMTSVDGLEFEGCYARKEDIDIDGLNISFLDFNSLIENKKSTGRLQDLADVEKLLEGRVDKDARR
jgi:hypothetical protein